MVRSTADETKIFPMKIVFKIARNELRYLFYSPIAWFLLIVFLVQCSMLYSGYMYNIANYQTTMRENSPGFKDAMSLTKTTFGTMFIGVMSNLYIFIPLLTMGLMGREFDSGSAKLLFSSPIKLRHIVLGKYLGIATYSLLLVFIVAVFAIVGVFNIRNADYGLLLSALLGFYLLVCTLCAIGLFMSTFSNNQIVAAFSTFVVIFVLGRIDSLWQRYDLVRDLTYFLSLQNRTWKMLAGLIISRDVIYFIAVTFMFIGFTLIKLRAGREARPWYVRAGRYGLVMLVTLAIGYISSRHTLTGYLDTTATKANTIPKEMQKILKDFDDSPVEVTLYTNLMGDGLGHGMPEARNVDYLFNFWDPYLRFKPDIKFKYVYYYNAIFSPADSVFLHGKSLRKIAAESADAMDADLSMFKSPEEMNRIIDLRPENYRLIMQVKYKGRTALLRTYNDSQFWPDLNNMSFAFKRVLGGKVPKIYFVTGNLERSIELTGERQYNGHSSYKGLRASLVNVGFDIDTVNLTVQNILPDADMLVLADPKMDLSPTVQSKLTQFVDEGGNLLITGEPGKQYVLNPFLQHLGVQLMNGQLVEPSFDETPEKVRPVLTEAATNLHASLGWYKEYLHSRAIPKMLMPGVTVFQYDSVSPFSITPLLETVPDKAWFKAGELITDSTLPAMNTKAGDFKDRTFVTSIQLTRKVKNKEQRIIICGDADFASNLRFGTNYYITSLYSWITYNRFPVYMTRLQPKDNYVRIGPVGATVQKIIFVWVLPGLLLLFGTILLIRRKRK